MTKHASTRYGPNFFVIGAQKAGTTRLCSLLQRHPAVAIPIKEPLHFQSARAVEERAQWYKSIFQDVAHLPARGDGSSFYSMCGIYPGTARRIYDFNPDARIIYMVRHPLRRIESSWWQWLSTGDVSSVMGFEHTLYRTQMLIDPTLYWKQFSEYRRYFPTTQIRIVFFEEFVVDETSELRECLAFLGVDSRIDIETADSEGRNPSEGKRRPLAVVPMVRSIPGHERFTSLFPRSLREIFTQRINRPIEQRPLWTGESLAWTISQIAEDSAALLRYTGRDNNYWNM